MSHEGRTSALGGSFLVFIPRTSFSLVKVPHPFSTSSNELVGALSSPQSSSRVPSLHAQAMATVDTVRASFSRQIAQYRAQSFEQFLTRDLAISPHPDAKKYLFGHSRLIGYSHYIVQLYGSHKETVAVKLVQSQVFVQHHRSWKAVQWYLDNISTQTELQATEQDLTELRQSRAWALQSEWWAMNGKVFAFASLPPEIRECLYAVMLKGIIHPYPRHKHRRLGRFAGQLIVRQPSLRAFMLNRQIYEESRHFFYLHNTFVFEHMRIYQKCAAHKHLSSLLRRLELAFTYGEFFSFFGVPCTNEHNLPPSRVANALGTMSLNGLTLRIAPPVEYSPVPWLNGACQRRLFDLCLKAALPFMRGHNVSITGYVKYDQKYVAEAYLRAERERYELWMETSRASGFQNLSLARYQEWLQCIEMDEDGGVLLSDKEFDSSESEEHLDAFGDDDSMAVKMQCSCEPSCSLKFWDPSA